MNIDPVAELKGELAEALAVVERAARSADSDEVRDVAEAVATIGMVTKVAFTLVTDFVDRLGNGGMSIDSEMKQIEWAKER
ncbi:hypothetical protein [Acidipropionibacterium virtanenii]|uniref:Uncharacterized protein n=1 Tax=Acidipropionibacterium virtanenii TaxID=2057246 RepID=A0A344UR20_9ACTN|nr:hypothetical protein [Acidipropionibacterium virtanenii]AXE37718.1 hypothetical protein JS278_00525 [Acidipropionibacterium virtanenii]